jgi:hypothetical protein
MASYVLSKQIISSYGFIISRHVRCSTTNKYWNHSIKCIRHYYPFRQIVVIDDNSNNIFIKADMDYNNVIIIKSEFPGRGELLPYYYFYKNKFFNNAVIIHDSIFFHKKINFDKYLSFPVLCLWHFNPDKENIDNTLRITKYLTNNYAIQESISMNKLNILGLNNDEWTGCFGLQSFINYDFLVQIQNKYNIFNMLECVTTRADRCSMERIMGVIFSKEMKKKKLYKSIFGNIMNYEKWGYSFDNYEKDLYIKKRLPKYIIKVWTGR